MMFTVEVITTLAILSVIGHTSYALIGIYDEERVPAWTVLSALVSSCVAVHGWTTLRLLAVLT